MNALAWFCLWAVIVSTIACNKGDNGGPAPQPAPVAPASVPSGQCMPNMSNPSMFLPPPPQMGPGSFDIVQGKILNRQFRLIVGGGNESGTDSCLNDEVNGNSYQLGFRLLPPRENLILNFDNQGILVVSIINMAGILNSGPIYPAAGGPQQQGGPIYYLDDSTQSLVIPGPFELHGSPSQQYVNMETAKGNRTLNHMIRDIDRTYKVTLPDFAGQNNFDIVPSGFRSDFQPGQTPGMNPGYPVPPQQQPYAPQAQQAPCNNGNDLSAVFPGGLQAQIRAFFQHISQLSIRDANYAAHSTVVGNGPSYGPSFGRPQLSCVADSQINFRAILQ